MGEVSVKTKQVIYYHDELTDEFSTAQIKARKIDENYCYDNNTRLLMYSGIASLQDLLRGFI